MQTVWNSESQTLPWNIYIFSNDNYLVSQELTYYYFAKAAHHHPNGIKYPEEPLRWNYSRLVPNSLSNYRYYFALLSIEHFLHCSLAALTVGFFFWPTNCMSFDFFQLVWQGWPFFFFFLIYIFSTWQWFVVYFHLQITCGFFFSYHKGYYLIYIDIDI